MRIWLPLIGSSLLAIATSAAAQTAPVEGPAADAATDDVGAGEIIVTAQKREQRLQDVPVTVNVVDAKALEQQNITSVGDLSRAVPALGGSFLGTTPSIRGVATGGFSRSSEEAVSTVLDGVVLGRTAITQLFDVERVEVLSGPQGMLFGKNASAGVINIATVSPKFDQFEVIGSADIGNYEYQRGRLTLNVPVGSTAALRVSGFYAGDDTRARNTVTGKRNESQSWGGRGRFRFEPSDSLAINLIADYEKTTATGNFPFVLAILPTEDPLGTVTLDSQAAACGIVVSPRNTLNCGTGIDPRTATIKRYGFSGQIDYTLPGDYVVTSITAKRFLKTGEFGYYGLGGDTDVVQADILNRNLAPSNYRVFSQELRLTSPADQFVEFVAGLYYSKASNRDEIFQAGGLGYLPAGAADARYQRINIDQRSLAAFGQATVHATDQLSFILGGRFTNEKVSDFAPTATPAELAAILAAQGLVYVPVGFGAGFVSVDEKVKDSNFSWRLGAQYEFSRDAMIFATASRGYKGPAVSDQGARVDPVTGLAVDPIVKPEVPMSYEVGGKVTLLDGKLFASLTLFHTKVKNFQTQIFAPAVGILPAGFIQGNAPYIRTRGVDFSIFGRPFDGFTMSAGAIYNDAEYSPDFLVACAPQQTTGVGDCSAARTTRAVGQLSRTPKFRLVFNGEYAREFSSSLTGFIQSDFQYQTKTFTSPNPDPILRLPSTFFLNGRVGVRSSDGAWSASIFGRNLLGKYYNIYQQDFLSLPGNGRLGVTPGSQPGYLTVASTDQRTTYGVSIDFRF